MHLQWARCDFKWLNEREDLYKETKACIREQKSSCYGDTEAEQFKYFFLPADSPAELTGNITTDEKHSWKVKAPFAGHPAVSSAWTPAATPSLLGGLESHCNKERQWHFVKSNQRTARFKKSLLHWCILYIGFSFFLLLS